MKTESGVVRATREFRSRLLAGAALAAFAFLPLLHLFAGGRLPVFRDGADFFLPIAAFTARVLAQGEIPLWNPASFAGEPWMAAIQPAVFYPTAIAYRIAPSLADAHRLVLLTHHLLLVVGLYRLGRRLGLGRSAALLGSALAGLGAPLASVAEFENNLRTLAWFPWALEGALVAGRAAAARSGIFLALAFLGGEPELAAIAAALVALVRLTSGSIPRRRAVVEVAAAGAVAALLSGPVLVPFLELVGQSDRGRGLGAAESSRNSLDAAGLIELLSAPGREGGADGRQDYLPVFSVGLAVGALAVAEAVRRWREAPRCRPVVAAAVVLLAAALLPSIPAAQPLLELVRLPFRYPVRLALPVALFALPLAAAFGWERFASGKGTGAWRGVALAAGVIAALALPFAVEAGPLATTVAVTGGALVLLGLPALGLRTAAVALAALLVADAGGLALGVPSESLPDAAALAAPPLAERAWREAPGLRVIGDPPVGPALAVRADAPAGRFLRSRVLAFGYSNLLGGAWSARGGGPILLDRYERYLTLAHQPNRMAHLLGALRVGWFLTLGRVPLPAVEPVAREGGATLWRWEGAAPRAWIVEPGSWSAVAGPDEAFRALADPAFDPQKRAVVEGLPPRAIAPSPATSGARWRVVSVAAEERERIVIRCDTSGGGLLVVPDAWFPGWEARIGGRRTEIFPVNGLFRGVFVPPGPAFVEMVYRPLSLRVGMAAAAAGIVLVVALLATSRTSPKQEERPA